ncbi:hypothetical protein EGT74_06490 [Chitinophaga lutea]|uniref:Uncharacterized protein n=1 Tax=Chitinophaga lutea TaxID=2488634 RepID=A0A3N4Q0P8_9BACT|nr:hypothetical protein [Chitinophaga lutea]RPE13175.1 hypothetical protein EGT74_06490 [Chitinophaga lutea]
MDTAFIIAICVSAIPVLFYSFMYWRQPAKPIIIEFSETAHPAATHSLVDIPRAPQGPPNFTDTTAEDEDGEDVLEPADTTGDYLLKAAENVVEKIQEQINHIASDPPNPEEVHSKIRAILVKYSIFHHTDYYEAINTYISVSVERDLDLRLTKAEIESLWQPI